MNDTPTDRFLRGGAYAFLTVLLLSAIASLLLGVYALASWVL